MAKVLVFPTEQEVKRGIVMEGEAVTRWVCPRCGNIEYNDRRPYSVYRCSKCLGSDEGYTKGGTANG